MGERTLMARDTWVFIESADSGATAAGLELLAAGRVLTAGQGGGLVAVVIGHDVDAVVRAAAAHGAETVIAVDAAVYGRYTTIAYTHALAVLAEKYRPDTILISATHTGRDLAPRLACRLGTGLTADCTGLEINARTGEIEWLCPAFGGRLMAAIVCPSHRPRIGTVRPGAFEPPTATSGEKSTCIAEDVPFAQSAVDTALIERVMRPRPEENALESAGVVVAVGHGIGGPEGVQMARAFAAGLGAAFGGTRPVVERGWLEPERQIGQSGKFIRPDLYFACGISGAAQHTVGIRNPGIVVAVNTDPTAPIFDIADYGLVADVRDVLPLLMEYLVQNIRP